VQKIYNDLVVKGKGSIENAYRVGAWIEDLEIHDLTNCMARISKPDIKQVFENLRRGSHNHLRTFNRQLTSLDVDYKPEYISQSEFDQIVSQGVEQGQQCNNQINKKC
jgi:rubrerythrin